MDSSVTRKCKVNALKILFNWGIVVAYTILLPYIIIPYRFLSSRLPADIMASIPLMCILAFTIIYIIAFIRKVSFRRFLKTATTTIVPSVIIVFFIVQLVSNPNKHIHIPEYIVMTWLLYQALVTHYRGKGFYLLILISASLLGIIEEIEQGLHPSRFYGLTDMLVNTASSIIGVLTLIGLRKPPQPGPGWTHQLMKLKYGGLVLIFGVFVSASACFYLFKVQSALDFWNTYPIWLLAGNAIYLFVAFVLFIIYLSKFYRMADQSPQVSSSDTAPLLWNLVLMGILFFLNSLVIIVAFSNIQFK